jgi:N-acetylmuramoyl-L-alanine amidase
MLVILDRQHGDRRNGRPFDPGATFGPLRETDLCDAYIAVAAEVLRSRGHEVETFTTGPYDLRHSRAVSLARGFGVRVAYVACHVNAGGGSYALVEYDARSRGGTALAEALAEKLGTLPEVTAGKTKALSPGARGFVCIDGIYSGPANIAAALVEPGFVDTEAHAELWTPAGLQRIGTAIALAVEAWGAA